MYIRVANFPEISYFDCMASARLTKISKKLKKLSGRSVLEDKVYNKKRLFETKYGYFRRGGREFVITTPNTPGLWANFLTNGKYTALLSPTGGGYSWVEESGFNRVLREYPYRHLIEDQPGRYIYLKDQSDGVYWSINYQPVRKGSSFEAVHSLGYSSTSTIYRDIYGKITYFIPPGGTYEIWQVQLKNNSKKKKTLKLYTYSEFVLGSFKGDVQENAFNSFFTRGRKYKGSLLFYKTSLQTKDNLIMRNFDKIGFVASSRNFKHYELSKKDFIGFGNSFGNPQMLESNKKLSSCEKAGENLIGCVELDVVLKAGEEKRIYFAIGTVKEESGVAKISNNLTDSKVKSALKKIRKFWDSYIKKVWIETPDKGLNIWFNYWLKYQTYFNAHWSEMDSFYIGGGGGFGVRDTAQHIWGALPFEKDIYKKQMNFLLEYQSSDGSMPHGVRLFTKEPLYSPHSDDPCWLVFVVLNYIEETNDIELLSDRIPFYGSGATKETGSVLRHIIRATDYSLRHLSERGIPQIRIADWNDGLSAGKYGKGESFLVAGLLASNLKRLVELLERIGRFDKVREYNFAYKRIYESVKKFGWDGKWFLRATEDHRKKPIGSKKNKRGKIFLDSNTWLCMSGLAGSKTAETLSSLWEHLMTKHGALLFNPAYKSTDVERGIISQFVPGSKENAAIFMHTNAWFLISLSLAGESDKALELLATVNPVHAYFRQVDTYKVEPYVLAEFIFGKQSDKFGEGSFTWVTGSAEWFLRGILDYFLGVKPRYDKLEFNPKVPENWEFTVKREFQGKSWKFEYKKGKKRISSK